MTYAEICCETRTSRASRSAVPDLGGASSNAVFKKGKAEGTTEDRLATNQPFQRKEFVEVDVRLCRHPLRRVREKTLQFSAYTSPGAGAAYFGEAAIVDHSVGKEKVENQGTVGGGGGRSVISILGEAGWRLCAGRAAAFSNCSWAPIGGEQATEGVSCRERKRLLARKGIDGLYFDGTSGSDLKNKDLGDLELHVDEI